MSQTGEVDMFANENAGEGDNMREALRSRFADLNSRACALKTDFIRQIDAYEANPQNQANIFAFHLNRLYDVFDSLQHEFYSYEVNCCLCDNPRAGCRGYSCDPIKRIHDVFYDVNELIWESWSSDLGERAERQAKKEMDQVLEDLPTIKISKNHLGDFDLACPICLSHFELKEEACHLFCNENHIFHTKCIQQWLERQNMCPMCRAPTY